MNTEDRIARIEAIIKGNGDFRDSRSIGPNDTAWLVEELRKWEEACRVNADALRDMSRRADNNRLETVELRAQLAAANERVKEAKQAIQREVDQSDCAACRVFLSGVIAALSTPATKEEKR